MKARLSAIHSDLLPAIRRADQLSKHHSVHGFTLVTIFLDHFYITSPFKMLFLARRCKQLRILRSLHCSPLFCSSLSSSSVERGIDWELVIPVLERLFSTSRRFHPNNILLLSLVIIARGSRLSSFVQDHKCIFPSMTRQDHSRIFYMHCNNDTVQKNEDNGAPCYIT